MTLNRPSILPSILGGVVIATLFWLMAFRLVPRAEAIFADLLEGAQLPVATRLILAYGRPAMVLAGLVLGIGVVAGGLVRELRWLRWLRWVSVALAILLALLVSACLFLPLAQLNHQLSAGR
ncbi:MAG: hypothetical protein H7A46_03605 [Verrucomicrobiales bacterium]|nr:hypothetical protein [Verrucomicrobiales bacterium]